MNPPEKTSIKLGAQNDWVSSINNDLSPPNQKESWKPTTQVNPSTGQNIELCNGSPVKDSMARYEKYSLDPKPRS